MRWGATEDWLAWLLAGKGEGGRALHLEVTDHNAIVRVYERGELITRASGPNLSTALYRSRKGALE